MKPATHLDEFEKSSRCKACEERSARRTFPYVERFVTSKTTQMDFYRIRYCSAFSPLAISSITAARAGLS